MASFSPLSFLFFLFSFAFFFGILTCDAACSSQPFSKNRTFSLCRDLPRLNASLHWTYNPTKASISLAFVAPPAKSGGWIAWAINPISTGMVGCQALIAFRGSNGSIIVNTYNVAAYDNISLSRLSFPVSALEGESSGSLMRIFATVALPKNQTTVNHVWQVGASVSGTSPAKHDFGTDNLNSKETLDLLTGTIAGGEAPAPSPSAPAPTTGRSGGEGVGGGPTSAAPALLFRSLPFAFSVVGILLFPSPFSCIV